MALARGEIQIRTICHLHKISTRKFHAEDGSQLQICTVRKKKISPIPDAASERV